MAQITPADSQLLQNKLPIDPVFPEGLVETTGDYFNRARKTLIAKELASFISENANSYYQGPTQQSNMSGLTTNNGTAVTRFEISRIPNLAKIDSVRIDFDVQNAGPNNGYVSPVPSWFSRVDISLGGSAASAPIWSSISQGGILPDHLFNLMLLDREDALRILALEGFQPSQYVMAGEDNIQFSSPGANQVLIEKHSPLECGNVIPAPPLVPPGQVTTRTYSLYILNSPLTQTGFNLGMLRGDEKATISLSWKAGNIWVDPSQPLTITDIRLSFEGKRCSDQAYSRLLRALEVRGRSIAIPFSRPIAQFFEGSFAAGSQQSFTTTQFSKSMLGLCFYIGAANPSMSSGVGTPEQRQNLFVQGFGPQTITIDSGAGTSSVVAGNTGADYFLRAITLKAGGTVVMATPNLSASQVGQLANSSVENGSYLIPIYQNSIIVYPFSSNLKEAVIEQRAFSRGMADLQGNLAIEFVNVATPPVGSRLFVSGYQACELVYSADDGFQIVT